MLLVSSSVTLPKLHISNWVFQKLQLMERQNIVNSQATFESRLVLTTDSTYIILVMCPESPTTMSNNGLIHSLFVIILNDTRFFSTSFAVQCCLVWCVGVPQSFFTVHNECMCTIQMWYPMAVTIPSCSFHPCSLPHFVTCDAKH